MSFVVLVQKVACRMLNLMAACQALRQPINQESLLYAVVAEELETFLAAQRERSMKFHCTPHMHRWLVLRLSIALGQQTQRET
jgi:hypothetical protein